jgi:DNA-binding NtrC family response regulator
VHSRAIEAAARGQRLMILGPSGSGKELVARAYHRHTGRAGPFVAINCAELDDRVRAELFGTEAGAYTDAVRRAGAVEAASGGTLFLDEVGELPKDVQAMLLRFLDRGEFARTGDLAKLRKADVRIVCATNRDLREEVRQGRFRLDLWFRLASQVVEVPPLHQRREDLVAYLSRRKHTGAASTWAALSPRATEVVIGHRWDGKWGGNFRELENFAARLPPASGPGTIDATSCRHAIESGAVAMPSKPPSDRSPDLGAASWATVAAAAASRAAESFAEDHGGGPPDWNAVKDYIENHLKPVLFAKLAGVGEASTLEEARSSASRLGADRATRTKQIERYFERFKSPEE